jgi:hypothetical protein
VPGPSHGRPLSLLATCRQGQQMSCRMGPCVPARRDRELAGSVMRRAQEGRAELHHRANRGACVDTCIKLIAGFRRPRVHFACDHRIRVVVSARHRPISLLSTRFCPAARVQMTHPRDVRRRPADARCFWPQEDTVPRRTSAGRRDHRPGAGERGRPRPSRSAVGITSGQRARPGCLCAGPWSRHPLDRERL